MDNIEQSSLDSSTRIVLKTKSGKFVLIGEGDKLQLHEGQSTKGNSAPFEMFHLKDWQAVLKAANGQFVCLEPANSFIVANASKVEESTIFQVKPIDKTNVVLIAPNKFYIGLDDSTPANLIADVTSESDAHIFTITPSEVTQIDPKKPDKFKSAVPTKPQTVVAEPSSAQSSNVYTVCFAGTGCTRDEGEVSRPQSDKNIYYELTGYITNRLHKEISGSLTATNPSVTVRGVGENDWSVPRNKSEPLVFNGPLKADKTLLKYVKKYSGGNQLSKVTQINGWSAPALALHGANLAAASGAKQYNFVGHSRGAVEAIMAAWFLYAYGSESIRKIPINIFAIDPVPGTGEWYSILTQLPPNVSSYIGVYAWDQCVMPEDKPFSALVPRPNGRMMGKNNDIKLSHYWYWPMNRWMYLANDCQNQDPLKPANDPQPKGYELFACRGRHSTVAGNITVNGGYNAKDVAQYSGEGVESVPALIYRMARAYLTKWGVKFKSASEVQASAKELRVGINLNHRHFDAMGGGATRTSMLPNRPYVRRVSSIYGKNPFNTYYMDDVVGDPPYTMAYPVTNERKKAGWVKWQFL